MLIGCVVRGRAWSTLRVSRGRSGFLVLAERGRVPGCALQREAVYEQPTFAQAVRAAQAVVLAAGGSLGHDERALLGASVGARPIEQMGPVPQGLVPDLRPEGPARRSVEQLVLRPGLAFVGVPVPPA